MDENIKKFGIIRTVVLLSFILVIVYAIKLQIIEGKKYYRLSEENCIKKKYITAPRGNIFDRNNNKIADTRPGFYVSVIPAIVDENTLDEISHIFNIDKENIKEKIKIEKNPFMSVKIIHDIGFEQLSIIEEKREELEGVEVGVEPLRNYPYRDLTSHLLGYVGEVTSDELKKSNIYLIGDYIGRMGLEKEYDKILRGAYGIEYVEVDAKGREIGEVFEKRPISVTPGTDLYTTIDLALTESTAIFLKDYQRAGVVCLNPKNGEIFVLYSKPGFDPNVLVHGLNTEEWQKLNSAKNAPMYNRAIMSCYPCGSTFKPFVALAALDARMISKNRYFDSCRGVYFLNTRAFKCWHIHGRLPLIDAIVHSCDIYFYQLGRFIGIDTIVSRTKKIGFGRLANIDLPQEKSGLLPDRQWFEQRYGKSWTEGHIFNLSIGQGDLLVTPLQLACAYTLFINNGNIPTPHLIKGKRISFHKTNITNEAIEIVKQGLLGVVTFGTGVLARVENIEVCGKTGTAQNPHGEDHSLFVGYAPANDPQILVCVFVENAGHGGSVAAPIAGKIMRTFLQQTIKISKDTTVIRNYVQKN